MGKDDYESINLLYSWKLLYMSKAFGNTPMNCEVNMLRVMADAPDVSIFLSDLMKMQCNFRKKVDRYNRDIIATMLDTILPYDVTTLILLYSYPKTILTRKRYTDCNGQIPQQVYSKNSKSININGCIVLVNANATPTNQSASQSTNQSANQSTNAKIYNVLIKKSKVMVSNLYEPAYTYHKVYKYKNTVYTDVWIKT